SVIDVVDALRDAGAEVLGIVSIFTYGMQKSVDRLAAANVKNVSLTNLDTLIEAAVEENYIQPGDADRIRRFRDDPSDESWIGGDE
ncbi:MAG: orotate phosphoribosyltransferase, partial [Clostridia bacterium]|nr:orotate phosphoribosyltransferase [Clostridia bacterium]